MANLSRLLGDSAPIAEVRTQAARLVHAGASPGRRLPPILILGETGTGKGLLADAIHPPTTVEGFGGLAVTWGCDGSLKRRRRCNATLRSYRPVIAKGRRRGRPGAA